LLVYVKVIGFYILTLHSAIMLWLLIGYLFL
jgi:hypothetical protein